MKVKDAGGRREECSCFLFKLNYCLCVLCLLLLFDGGLYSHNYFDSCFICFLDACC